jgi:hypothetical protein
MRQENGQQHGLCIPVGIHRKRAAVAMNGSWRKPRVGWVAWARGSKLCVSNAFYISNAFYVSHDLTYISFWRQYPKLLVSIVQ